MVNSNFYSILYLFRVIRDFLYNGISYVGTSKWRVSDPSSPNMETFPMRPPKGTSSIKKGVDQYRMCLGLERGFGCRRVNEKKGNVKKNTLVENCFQIDHILGKPPDIVE